MKDYIVVVFIGQLLLCATGGPINSDPAPGRSPGPPLASSASDPMPSSSDLPPLFINPSQQTSNEVFTDHSVSIQPIQTGKSKSNQLHDQLNIDLSPGKHLSPTLQVSSLNELNDKTLKNSNEFIASSSSSSTSSSFSSQSSDTVSTLSSSSSILNLCYENFIRNNDDKIIKLKHSDNDDIINDELKSSLHLGVINNVFGTENGLLPNIIYIGESQFT